VGVKRELEEEEQGTSYWFSFYEGCGRAGRSTLCLERKTPSMH
jgi:hypothetical protein